MNWTQLHLRASREHIDAVEDALLALGAVSITLGDQGDEPILEPGVGETPLWPQLKLSALFELECDRQSIQRQIATQFGDALSGWQWETLEDRIWEREWLQHFRPMRFGKHLWVCPRGEPAGAADAVVVQLDPGLAFGTGTHASTALCLEWLDAHPPAGLQVVDFGCGSGILGIAALLLGAREVDAVDIDPQALIATRDNALANALAMDRIRTGEPEMLAGMQTDLLLANILAGPLVSLAPRFAEMVPPGGHAVLAGVLQDQAEAVCQAYAPWFALQGTASREQWCRLDFTRSPDVTQC